MKLDTHIQDTYIEYRYIYIYIYRSNIHIQDTVHRRVHHGQRYEQKDSIVREDSKFVQTVKASRDWMTDNARDKLMHEDVKPTFELNGRTGYAKLVANVVDRILL